MSLIKLEHVYVLSGVCVEGGSQAGSPEHKPPSNLELFPGGGNNAQRSNNGRSLKLSYFIMHTVNTIRYSLIIYLMSLKIKVHVPTMYGCERSEISMRISRCECTVNIFLNFECIYHIQYVKKCALLL